MDDQTKCRDVIPSGLQTIFLLHRIVLSYAYRFEFEESCNFDTGKSNWMNRTQSSPIVH